MTPDLINGAFEAGGMLFIYGHVRKIQRDKQVRGVFWPAVAYFTLWGFWNIFYYPHLGQWWSLAGGLGIAAMNTWWVYLLLKYRGKT